MIFSRELVVLMVCCAFASCRTIKSKILTNENGTKEIIFNKNMILPQGEIDFLIDDLKGMNITVTERTEESTALPHFSEGSTEAENGPEMSKELTENILWKHWNSLTEVGWNDDFKNPVRKMYVNNTRALQLNPAGMTDFHAKMENDTEKSAEVDETGLVKMATIPKLNQTKFARKIWQDEAKGEGSEGEGVEDVTESVGGAAEEPSNPFQIANDLQPSIIKRILDAFRHVFQCAEGGTLRDGFLRCLASRIRSVLNPAWKKLDEDADYYLGILEGSFCNHTANSTGLNNNSQRTFYYRQKKFLYTVVLPMVTIVLVKYLLILPFLLFGMFVMKSLLLGLISAGTATLHSLAKKYEYFYPRFPVKGYRHVQDIEVNSAGHEPNFFWSQGSLAIPEDERGVNMVPLYNKFHM